MNLLVRYLLIFGLILVSVIVQAAEPATPDRNGDGNIERDEYNHHLIDTFFLIDSDKDGLMTISEMRSTANGFTHVDFSRADSSRDGVLTLHEYLRALASDFKIADKNHDGLLSKKEVQNYFK